MRTKNIQNIHSLRQMISLFLSIALAFVVINQIPARVIATSTTQSVPMLNGTLTAVNNSFGSQTNPHVNRNRVSYTNDDFEGTSLIHFFDFATATDNVVPANGFTRLSDVADNRVVFTEFTASGDHIVVFDTTTQTRTFVSGFRSNNAGIGSNSVVFEDRSSTQSDVDVYDFGTSTLTALTNDALFDKNPQVSPTGNAVVWEKCQNEVQREGVGCDIYSAVQTSPGVFTTRQLTDSTGEDHRPDTNGEVVVYTSTRGSETDVYYQPVVGGTETHIPIPGDQRDVRVSGNLIVFESDTGAGYDVFVYDITGGSLYQLTNTPLVSETLSDISVWNGTGRVVYAAPGGGDFDVFAITFQIPSSVQGPVNDLIALVTSFHLPHGIENSLLTKLQSALAALNASDTATTCDALKSFTNQSSAQSGKALTEEQASQLINAASQIRTTLGCQ